MRRNRLHMSSAFARPLLRTGSTLTTSRQISRMYTEAVEVKTPVTSPSAKKQAPQSTFGNLDIRVGRIQNVSRHPNADTLYVEQIDVGEAEPRTIISGLVKYLKEEDLKSRLVLVLCNLPAKEMRGISSNGMVLAASSTDEITSLTRVALLEPPEDSQPGDAIFVEGEEPAIIPTISGNKLDKILKRCQVDANGVAQWTTSDGGCRPFQSASGPCTSSITHASIA